MSKTKGKNQEVALAKQVIVGVGKHFAGVSTLTFGGGSSTPAEVTGQLQTLVDLRTVVTTAQTAEQSALAKEDAQAPAIVAMMVALLAYVKAMFAGQPAILADFGVAPRKARVPLTATKQAAANAKRKATLQARGPTGKKQRAAIKGAVTGVVVTPIEAPAAVATPPAGSTTGGSTPHGA